MDIDFVITWVDGNDPAWQEEKAKYAPPNELDSRNRRFREWDNLQYLFRGIETYAPWVHKVFLVTCGHYPSWLNTNHPKLQLVKHSDYIPEEWLPTFSSRCIDMNFHRIKGLSEYFVYFNDDMFITDKVEPEDFFRKGLPCDTAILLPSPPIRIIPGSYPWLAPIFCQASINRNFDKKKQIRKNLGKYLTPCYGRKFFKNLAMLPFSSFGGFASHHFPYGYLKSTYKEVWEKEELVCTQASSRKFRRMDDVNHWLMTYWQLASGTFTPRSDKIGHNYRLYRKALPAIRDGILNKKNRLVCLNDNVKDENFEIVKEELNEILQLAWPNKSSFEK